MKINSIILGLTALLIFLVLTGCKASPDTDSDATITFKGCYVDEQDRDLDGYSFDSEEMTNTLCIKICQEQGFKYAATEYSNECYCGNTYGKYGIADADECNEPCAGDPESICGGYWTESVYQIK